METPTRSQREFVRLTATSTVREGRDAYLAENGFTLESYTQQWVKVAFPGFTISIPNPPARQRAVRWHDIHHVATRYGTDSVGEGEISAWELRRGLKGLGTYVGAIVLGGTLLGLMIAPQRTLRAWFASGKGYPNLFSRSLDDYEAVLALSIEELRAQLGVAREGLASERALHVAAPKPIAA
jgi:hypothetical protein